MEEFIIELVEYIALLKIEYAPSYKSEAGSTPSAKTSAPTSPTRWSACCRATSAANTVFAFIEAKGEDTMFVTTLTKALDDFPDEQVPRPWQVRQLPGVLLLHQGLAGWWLP
jgi:hypothetical protein